MKKWFFIFFLTFYLLNHSLFSQNFTKNQFNDESKTIIDRIKEIENSFKNIDKEIKKRFPPSSEKSFYYLNIIDEFNDLNQSVNQLSSSLNSFENLITSFEKSFGGPLSRKNKIISNDEDYNKVKELVNTIQNIINECNEKFPKIKSLEDFLNKSFVEIDEIKELVKDSEKEIISFRRDIEKLKIETKEVIDNFKTISSWLINFPVYDKGIILRDDLYNFQQNINQLQIELEENENNIKKLFSGVSNVKINEPWKYFQELKKNQLSLIGKTQINIQNIPNKKLILIEFGDKIDFFKKNVLTAKLELEKFIRLTFRIIDQSISDVENSNKNFESISKEFENFPIVLIGKNINDSLKFMINSLVLSKDSIQSNLNKYEKFLSSKYFPEDQITHTQFFEKIKLKVNDSNLLSEKQLAEIEFKMERLNDVVKLIEEFKIDILDMNEKIISVQKKINLKKEIILLDSLIYQSLINKIPTDFSLDVFPYLELSKSYIQLDKKLIQILIISDSLITTKEIFIKHVATMNGIRNEKLKYDQFKTIKSDFINIDKSSKKEIENLDELIFNFKNNILENFINTSEYWSIVYKINDEYETNFSENFGYLIDLNRFPVPQYHGELISNYQIKLIKNDKTYKINFLTSSDLPVKGFIILNSKEQIIIEKIFEDWEEIKLNEIEYLSSSVLISNSSLNSLIKSDNHILKIQFTSINNTVNHTRYETKIYKKYKIPEKRLDIWSNQLNN